MFKNCSRWVRPPGSCRAAAAPYEKAAPCGAVRGEEKYEKVVVCLLCSFVDERIARQTKSQLKVLTIFKIFLVFMLPASESAFAAFLEGSVSECVSTFLPALSGHRNGSVSTFLPALSGHRNGSVFSYMPQSQKIYLFCLTRPGHRKCFCSRSFTCRVFSGSPSASKIAISLSPR